MRAANDTRPLDLMSKEISVAKITRFYVEVLRRDLFPDAIRTPDVKFCLASDFKKREGKDSRVTEKTNHDYAHEKEQPCTIFSRKKE